MSERTNSCIELSEIRTLDNLLTQCESSSCEYICKDCCEKLGSIENVEHQTDNRTTDDDSVVIGCDGNNITVKSDAQLSLDSDNGIILMKQLTTTIDDQHFNDAVTSNCCRFCDANSVRSFSNQRRCSLEKDSDENQQNDSINCDGISKGGSDNTLVGKFRKHCSIKCDEKQQNHISVKACFKCDKQKMSNACSNGHVGGGVIVSPTQKRILGRSKSAKEHKSMGNSTSTKTSLDMQRPKRRVDIGCGDIDKDTSISLKDSKISLPLLLAKKMSVKNHHCSEELSLETLLGVHHEIKIPEPVEAVCRLKNKLFFVVVIALSSKIK